MNFLELVFAGMLEGETRDAGGSLLGDDLQALDHSGDNFVFDAGVKSFGIFAHHDQVHARVAGGNVREVANGPEVGEEFEKITKQDVDDGEAGAAGRGHGAPQSDAGALDGFAEFLGNVFLVLLKGFGAGGEAFPFEFDAGGFEYANRGLDDFGADAVAGDEGYFVDRKTLWGFNCPFAVGLDRLFCLQQILQFRHELLDVFEVEIDGGKPYIRDFVIAAQAVHDELADFAGLALALGRLNDEGLGFIDDLFQLADGNGPLLAGAHQAVEHFLAVKTLAPSVFFYHHVRDFVDALVGGEALFALEAFAAAAA